MAATLPPRSEVPEQYRWNDKSVFDSVDAWHAEYAAVEGLIADFAAFKERLAEGPAVLADAMDALEVLNRRFGKLYAYANMGYNVDTGDGVAAALFGQVSGLSARLQGAVAFVSPELLAIGEETLNKWMDDEERLAALRHYFDNLFRGAEHVRSAEVEQVMGMASTLFTGVRQIHSQLSNADMTFVPAHDSEGNKLDLAQASYRTLVQSGDRVARQTAWEGYHDEYLSHQHSLAETYITAVKGDWFRAQVRGFNTSLEAALHPDNIEPSVYHNLLNTFRANLPVWHRYWAVRKKALGVDTLHVYDTWAPLIDEDIPIPFEQAVEWITAALAPLGSEYTDALHKGCLEDRWVDVMPNHGKRQGAFSNGSHDTFPFIMMSYDGDIFSMSTLAHELGHSMHSYLSRRYQSPTNSRYNLFAAEVASNFNQAMTRDYMFKMKSDDRAYQIRQVEEAMYNFHRYFFIMPILAAFELEVHTRVEAGKSPNAADLNEIMADLFEEGYGGVMDLDRERAGIIWGTFLHLWMNFYTFKYATGISGAHALSAPILAGDEGAAERYVEKFLKVGGSRYAVDALRDAGVDLTTPAAVEATFAVMESHVARLEELFS